MGASSLFITRLRLPLSSLLPLPILCTGGDAALIKNRPMEMIMKLVLSALVALSFVAGAVAPAAAYSGSVLEQLDKQGRGGHNGG